MQYLKLHLPIIPQALTPTPSCRPKSSLVEKVTGRANGIEGLQADTEEIGDAIVVTRE